MRLWMIVFALCSAACIEPAYNDDIGVEGVATDPGSLAGTFVLITTLSDEAKTAIGDQTGGGQTIYLMERSYVDGDDYEATLDPCQVVNFEVAGLSSEISAATTKAIPKVNAQFHVDHPSGAITLETFRELWGLKDLKASASLPDDAGDDRIFDLEDDGNPGATLHTHGLVEGELYFVQRKVVSAEGVVTGEDETLGLTTHKKESFVIDATNDLLKSETDRHQHPDPKESWFHERRVDDGASCADVRDFVDDENLNLRPF